MKWRVRFGSLTMFAVALLLVIASVPYAKRYLEDRKCGKQLAVISQTARAWAGAHNGRLPSSFGLMSNELVSPRFLLCPGDNSREPADNWPALTTANSSYEICEGAFAAKDLPLEIVQNIPYLQCKVHTGNYANALGKVFAYSRPIPLTIRFLAGLAILAFLGRCLWQCYEPARRQIPRGTAASDLLPRLAQVRHDYLAARGMARRPWYRKGLMAAARHAVRALAFFRDRNPQGRENARTT
jgi:hypothetical protein